jgi:hypothetical protein
VPGDVHTMLIDIIGAGCAMTVDIGMDTKIEVD